MKFNIGDKVMIKSKEELEEIDTYHERFKFANLTGVIQRIDFGRYTICMDDDRLNTHYKSYGKEWNDNGIYWDNNMLRLANLNRRIIKEVI